MNRIAVVLGALSLVLSGVNTFLLVEIGMKLQHTADQVKGTIGELQRLKPPIDRAANPPEGPLSRPPGPSGEPRTTAPAHEGPGNGGHDDPPGGVPHRPGPPASLPLPFRPK